MPESNPSMVRSRMVSRPLFTNSQEKSAQMHQSAKVFSAPLYIKVHIGIGYKNRQFSFCQATGGPSAKCRVASRPAMQRLGSGSAAGKGGGRKRGKPAHSKGFAKFGRASGVA